MEEFLYGIELRVELCFQVYVKEDSESPPVVFKSSHYSISLLKLDIVRL